MIAQNQAETKQKNKNLIIKLILTKPEISRIELSKITGLSKMAVTKIVNELLDEGIITETGVSNTALGRKPIVLKIKDNAAVIIGVYISRDFIKCIAAELNGKIIALNSSPLKNESNKSLLKKLFAVIDKTNEGLNPLGIGVSSIGPVDSAEGIILNPPNFFDVRDLNAAKLLQDKYGLPVFLDNDMNASAIGEKYYGNAKAFDNFVYIGVTNGIGAGIVSGGRIYAGHSGFGGELGHITVEMNGKKCSCGNTGCLEMYASIPKNLGRMTTAQKSLELERICRYLSSGIITMINLFDPEKVFIGHDLAAFGEEAIMLLNRNISERYISSGYKQVKVELSAFGEKSAILGSAAIFVDRYFAV